VMERVTKFKMIFFFSYGGWESGGPRRVTCYDGADSMLQFRLEREDDMMKHF
jgi:hypothetical protein